MTRRIFAILTLCVLASWLTHSPVSAAEHIASHENLFDVESVSMDSGEIKNAVQGEISTGKKNRLDLGIPPALITRKLRKHNPGFAISVESVLRKLEKKEEIVLIDVRNREAFEKFRIPGSIHIPLFAIKTKGFLKSKPLVLINEGYHQAIPIPFGNDAEQFASKIKRATGRDKRSPLLSVLIFNESGEHYESIEKCMQSTGITNVFYLQDGLKGYKTFLKRQALLWQSKNRSTKTVERCPNCP